MNTYTAPALNTNAFTCPHCNAFAHMNFSTLIDGNRYTGRKYFDDALISVCVRCKQIAMWNITHSREDPEGNIYYQGSMVYPFAIRAPQPSDEMPDNIKKDYIEAAIIFEKSPRGAAALLRLCLQKLCIYLGCKGKKIDDDLAELAKKEMLPNKIIKAADVVRITGNNAVHPGTICDDDFDGIAIKLFELINIIVKYAITEPKVIQRLFESMPEGPRQAAENRDKPKSK